MCFYSRQTKKAVELVNRFKARIVNELQFELAYEYNGFSFPKTPVITNKDKSVIDFLQWGLIPIWAKDESIRQNTLNAKIETLAEKQAFKDNLKNRCLIIANGFYEWKWLDKKGKEKQKYIITLPGEELYCYAGLWSRWVNTETGEIVKSYTIVTTEANPLMSEINNSKKRMPVILTRDQESEWLSGRHVKDFVRPELNLIATPI
ncbi:MAG: SOS response-associated peptidase [Bacteroidota bacterium]|nr:SOS response-associated peptidase [Bacteroidota bacterium]MDP4290650.1 SOS response-associated peptidase [Bacteroidota bacterium]